MNMIECPFQWNVTTYILGSPREHLTHVKVVITFLQETKGYNVKQNNSEHHGFKIAIVKSENKFSSQAKYRALMQFSHASNNATRTTALANITFEF